jgi:Sensors of blue-light using FAD
MPELTQLIYVSRWNGPMEADGLQALVQQSAYNNRRRDVSGVLFVYGRSLMQLLEGEASTIDSLFTLISRDARHSDVDCLFNKPVARRLYPEWGMGLANLRSPLVLDRDRLRRIIGDLVIAPAARALSLESRVLLNDFREQARFAA